MATRWGCLGAGLIANDFFTAVKNNLPEDEHALVAIAARDLERAQNFAAKFQFKRAYGTYDDVGKDPEVEVVYIATLVPSHAELCIRMMDAGKHVLCEKPLSLNRKQTTDILDAAKRNKVLFVEGMWNRFFPAYDLIRQELTEKKLGKVKNVRAHYFIPFSQRERFQSPELGGGGCLEFCCYLVSFACMVYNEMPEIIVAVGNLTPTGVDESGSVILKYKSGAMACLMYHTSLPRSNSAAIYGEKGEIKLESVRAPTKVTTPSGTYNFPLKGDEQTESYRFNKSAGFQYVAAAMRRYIKSGSLEAKEMPHRHSEMTSAIMDEVLRQLGVVYPCD